MAEFKFSCPSCSQRISATEAYSGMQISCPACQKPLTVPMAPGAPLKPAVAQPVQAAPPQRPAPPSPGFAPKKKSKWPLIAGISAFVLVAAAAAFFFLKSKSDDDSGSSTDKKSSAGKEAKSGGKNKGAKNAETADIMQKVTDLYSSLTSYSATGKAVSVFDMSNVDIKTIPGMDKLPASQRNSKQLKEAMSKPQKMEAEFTVKLSRPDLYLVEWTQHAGPANMKGAIWSAGEGDFLLMAGPMKKYIKMTNQEVAIASATGISGGAAGTIPGIFFNTPSSLLSIFKDASVGSDDTIDGEDCYVVTGKTMGLKMILWISKSTYLIKQKQQVMGGELEMSKQDDQKMKDGLKLMGNKAPSEKDTKAMLKNLKVMASKMKGTMTETYENIEINKPIPRENFQYAVPSGLKLSSSLL